MLSCFVCYVVISLLGKMSEQHITQIKKVERIEAEAERLRLQYVQLQQVKKTHLREIEERVTNLQSQVLEAKQFELEANEKRAVLADRMDRLQQDIICTNKERRLMRKQLYHLKVINCLVNSCSHKTFSEIFRGFNILSLN